MRRGRPLYLSAERFARVQQLWREHQVAKEAVQYQRVVQGLLTWMGDGMVCTHIHKYVFEFVIFLRCFIYVYLMTF